MALWDAGARLTPVCRRRSYGGTAVGDTVNAHVQFRKMTFSQRATRAAREKLGGEEVNKNEVRDDKKKLLSLGLH